MLKKSWNKSGNAGESGERETLRSPVIVIFNHSLYTFFCLFMHGWPISVAPLLLNSQVMKLPNIARMLFAFWPWLDRLPEPQERLNL